ncbi:hypothetical protein GCM10028805_27150 [Spirosoma harenae]
MNEWTIDEARKELRHIRKQDAKGTISYSLIDLERLISDPRFPKRTNDDYIEKLRALASPKRL